MNRALLSVFLLLAGALTAGAQGGDQSRLKAAFVSKFPQFVAWPAAALAERQSFEICVEGSSATAADLRELTAGELFEGRGLVIRADPSRHNLSSCQVLFFTGQRPDRDLLARAVALPILTVSDSPGFLDAGGIIQLNVVERRVRFEVSLPAALRAKLTISSQLLRLAAAVRGER